ncbi:MAG: hypothetical protein J3Q66DRAFT_173286 [Benniella sp.]|nr:MAG: hypothetical protein J3Q66DRAFT_173286 [Benniella sp.]
MSPSARLQGSFSLIARRLFTSAATRSRGRNSIFAESGPSAAPRPAKNPFASPTDSVLAYVGPYSATLRQSKSVAFVFGACGCIAVPATLYLGNTEHVLATIAAVTSLSPSVLIHALFRNHVTKIHVQGSASTKTPGAVKISKSDPIKLTFEKLSWRGVPQQTQVLSNNLIVKSETPKSLTWTTTSATTLDPRSTATSSSSRNKVPSSTTSRQRTEAYHINKMMMMSNPSFAFVLDQIEHQSRLSRDGDHAVSKNT